MRREKLAKITKGKIFSVTFVKKNGDLRVMKCRTGVSKHLNKSSAGLSERQLKSDIKNNYLRVYDLEKEDYRTINCNTIKSIKCGRHSMDLTKIAITEAKDALINFLSKVTL